MSHKIKTNPYNANLILFFQKDDIVSKTVGHISCLPYTDNNYSELLVLTVCERILDICNFSFTSPAAVEVEHEHISLAHAY